MSRQKDEGDTSIDLKIPGRQLRRLFLTHAAAGIFAGLVVFLINRHPQLYEFLCDYIREAAKLWRV